MGSTVTEYEIDWLYRSRRIPEGVTCRIPGDEIEPEPQPGEHVVFLAHFERGFGLPASPFFREFLNFYELQPHHLPGNAIFYLSCYATFMEAYIGIRPTRETFARFFALRINSVQGKEIPKPKPPVECGSCIVGSRQWSTFFKFSGLESCRAWQGTFFYVKNNGRADLIDLPPFQVGPPSRANWSYNPKTDHAETNRVVRFMASLKKETNICSDDIIRTFISRRVLPLKHRAKDRFPLIQAERRGICVKCALDSFDPDPYICWKDLKMGKTPAARLGRSPPKPTGSSDDLSMLEIHEHAPPLRAEAGHEFVDKLMAKRTSCRYLMPRTRIPVPATSAPRNKLPGGRSLRLLPSSKRRQLPRRKLPRRKAPTWVTRPALPFSTNHPDATARRSSHQALQGCSYCAAAQDLQAHQGGGLQRPFRRPATVLHVSKAAGDTATRPRLLGRITSFARGPGLGHLLPYAQKWNAADMTPATRGLGKDRLPAHDPVGDRSRLTLGRPSLRSSYGNTGTSLRHTTSAKIPEASIEALKEQLAAAQREKDQLIRRHQEELSAQKTSYQELKSQLIQLGLDHAKALKAAETDAAAKMDEALEDAGNTNSVLLAELEELAKAQKVAEEKAARLEEEQKECNRLVLQTDTLAYRLRNWRGGAGYFLPHRDRLKGAGKRIREWRCSARAGADLPSASLAPGTGAEPGCPYRSARRRGGDLDPILTAKRQDRAYHIAEYADMRTFIPPPPDVKIISTRRRMKPRRSLGDAGAGDAPPEAHCRLFTPEDLPCHAVWSCVS
ncbi:hypothetical protein QYE76_060648 [Lolium multiflorum]|uniref:Transposase (putative) gypsy type domain-containing protein n=1 Tax=Lolium multiflorum TaxID=4521 RepID=A0AAD8W4H0_LOLMU|nr:hypothetical protein QYE76_060648 [Lolium multiflorum]